MVMSSCTLQFQKLTDSKQGQVSHKCNVAEL